MSSTLLPARSPNNELDSAAAVSAMLDAVTTEPRSNDQLEALVLAVAAVACPL